MPASRLIDQFDAAAGRCATDRELQALLGDAARELGFAYFALLHHASLRSAACGLVRIDTYPEAWAAWLLTSPWLADDPVHVASARTNIGFAWRELGSLVRLSSRQREILAEARRHDLGEGFTVPVNVPGEPCGSCSFAMPYGRSLPEHRLLCAEQIGAHAFRAARRIHDYPSAGRHPHLSRRERECLHLLAAGKTDWEIAVILGISPQTVHQYVKHARAAYDVVSRTQLVVHGLRDAWISFDDALPPGH
jgi:LuxR family quorum-sensing system transcriptional regulator CciR